MCLLTYPDDTLQEGHPECHLCNIVVSLPDELSSIIRDAWIASMVIQRQSQLIAQDSPYNRLRDRLLLILQPLTVPRLSLLYFYFRFLVYDAG